MCCRRPKLSTLSYDAEGTRLASVEHPITPSPLMGEGREGVFCCLEIERASPRRVLPHPPPLRDYFPVVGAEMPRRRRAMAWASTSISRSSRRLPAPLSLRKPWCGRPRLIAARRRI